MRGESSYKGAGARRLGISALLASCARYMLREVGVLERKEQGADVPALQYG